MKEQRKPWYAFRYGERAFPSRGGDPLRYWELDKSPEATERRKRLGAQMRKEFDENQKEILEWLEKTKLSRVEKQ